MLDKMITPSILNVEKDKIFVVYNVIEELNSYKTYELNITFTPLK